MKEIKSYFSTAEPKAAWIFFVSLVVMVIFMYQGHYTFFRARFADRFGSADAVEWLAYTYMHICTFLLFFLVPAAVIVFVFKQPLSEFGFRVGDWRFGLKFLALWIAVITPVVYANSFMPDFQREYPLVPLAGRPVGWFFLWALIYLVYYIGWEFLFRGFMQQGLKPALGPFYAICAQTIPSTILHFGKPQGETVSAILAGVVFGAVALRTRSFLWTLLAHFYVGMANDLFCLINGGGG